MPSQIAASDAATQSKIVVLVLRLICAITSASGNPVTTIQCSPRGSRRAAAETKNGCPSMAILALCVAGRRVKSPNCAERCAAAARMNGSALSAACKRSSASAFFRMIGSAVEELTNKPSCSMRNTCPVFPICSPCRNFAMKSNDSAACCTANRFPARS